MPTKCARRQSWLFCLSEGFVEWIGRPSRCRRAVFRLLAPRHPAYASDEESAFEAAANQPRAIDLRRQTPVKSCLVFLLLLLHAHGADRVVAKVRDVQGGVACVQRQASGQGELTSRDGRGVTATAGLRAGKGVHAGP